ncbi:universal stress protein [Conexibacter sp. SYSU D00693]|uniref:universal stress protein n=1 Tax=Conexibacter sp. SYSU D00693 TaxID=2812560 RepID=UPI00196AED90|nr:universal stress protein [Conexibacter sp. SYSU D00693]
MTRQIVVATHGDDDPTRDALALGVDLARATGGSLVLAAIWCSPLGPGDAVYEIAVREELEREVAAVLAEVPDDVPATVEVRGATSVVRGLHRVVEDRHAAVLVLGPTHLGALGHALRGDLAVAAVHDAPCAVAVAPEGHRHRVPGDARDVVLGFDGSTEAVLALEDAVDLARGTGGTLRLVHVVSAVYPLAADGWMTAPAYEPWYEDLRAAGARVLADGVAAVGDAVPVETALVDGQPSRELAKAADGGAFVVTGSRGYGALRRLVLGSTTAGLLRRAAVPVYVTPRASQVPALDEAAAVGAGV